MQGLKKEWAEVKNMMKISFSTLSISDFILRFVALNLQDDAAGSHPYPNFCALAKLYLCIPISSVDCDRRFSTYNLIKTSVRNRLQFLLSTVNTLTQMSVETPALRHGRL